ncbi:sulfite exporter TauE/SafE family protein [Synechococcus sp. RSCCF101]|nr:sulfite exporter TauE/SafE family protein [Synechococcus sp. RSCCF101]
MGLGCVAGLYATVGHAGASGYIAVFALAGYEGSAIRPIALVLNVLVASLATLHFHRAGHLRPGLLPPLLLASIPAAALGGAIALPNRALQPLLGIILLLSAVRLCWNPALDRPLRGVPPIAVVSVTGAGLGFMAGLTGTGGGIFLTPWMILRGWLSPRQAGAISAVFILVNSLSGLAGLLVRQGPELLPSPASLVPMALVVMVCGAFGAWCGSHAIPPRWIRRLLALVLLVASVKLLAVRF